MRLRLVAAAALAAGAAFATVPAHASIAPCQLGLIGDPTPSDPHSITYHYISYATCSVPNWACPLGLLGDPTPSDPHSITYHYISHVTCAIPPTQ
jgi:hypothetical protein